MDSLSLLFRNLGPLKVLGILAGVIAVIVSVFLVTLKYSTADLVPLYTNLDLKDSEEISKHLEALNVPFAISSGGSQILVPEDKVQRLRMTFATKGIPSTGSLVGYEIFDKSDSFGTSNFVQNVNLVRALEGELARTISSISSVDSARVHLVMPKRELFSRDSQKPSASVVLTLRGKVPLGKSEVNGILHLVATAVPGLDVERITIVDNTGRTLKLGALSENSVGGIISSSEDFRTEYEKRLKNTIEELLSQSIGIGKVVAEVSADINFDRVVTNSESYDPAGQVVRSVNEITDQESSSEKEASNVSVGSNLPNNQSQGAGSKSTNNSQHAETTTNYEISKTVKNQISEVGSVNKISVAVLVDGTYTEDPKDKLKMIYAPRTAAELTQLETLVKTAMGFDLKRGDTVQVINMKFFTDSTVLTAPATQFDWIKEHLPELIKTLVTGLVVVLILLLVVRPIATHAFEMTVSNAAGVASIGGSSPSADLTSGMINPEVMEAAKTEAAFIPGSTHKSVNEIFNKYPQETLIAIRKWLNHD